MTVGEVPRLPAGLVDELGRQAHRCRQSSPLYAELLEHCARDADNGGVTAALLAPYTDEPMATVPGLRLLAAVHRLVLAGRLPDLARYYPSVGGTERPEDAWPAFRAALEAHVDELGPMIGEPVQTNEPGRAASLYGGLLVISALTGLPIRLHEIGASAGLNLRADRFCYRVGGELLGDPASPLVLDEPWEGTPAVPAGTTVRVTERRGCDLRPIDPVSPDGQLRLLSLIWADPVRIERLRAALQVASRVPAVLDAAAADDWLADRLAEIVPGTVTVVWHSVVRQYVEAARWRRVGELLLRAGEFATSDAPVAHLAFEPDVAADGTYAFTVRLTLWPDGRTQTLAVATPHGTPTRWLPAGDAR